MTPAAEWVLVLALVFAPGDIRELYHVEKFRTEAECMAFGRKRLRRTYELPETRHLWRCARVVAGAGT